MEIVPIVSEALYAGDFWHRDVLKGIRERLESCAMEPAFFELGEKDELPETLERGVPVILLGTSTVWFSRMVEKARVRNIHAVSVGNRRSGSLPGESLVQLDFRNALYDAVNYLFSCGRKRIALLGVNPASAADNEKTAYFYEAMQNFEAPCTDAVFFNNGSIERTVLDFFCKAPQFDAVICPNDFVPFQLLQHFPDYSAGRLYIVSFGSTRLGRLVEPSLTYLKLRYREAGQQAVDAWRFLMRNPAALSVNCRVSCEIVPGATTEYAPVPAQTAVHAASPGERAYQGDNLFYRDPAVRQMMRLEALLAKMDGIDRDILTGVMDGESYELLAERLNVSDGTVKYRMKRMERSVGVQNRVELIRFLLQLTTRDALKNWK